MRAWSLPLAKIFGVEVRAHMFFLLLLAASIGYSNLYGISMARGIALWLLLLSAVTVRELARSIAAIYCGLELRSILLLPIGGVFGYANAESQERAAETSVQKKMAVSGPVANFACALVLGMVIYGATPDAQILSRPWVTPAHLIRSLVWLQLFLGLLHLLPAYPLDAGRVLRGEFSRSKGTLVATRAATGIGQIMAVIIILCGILFYQSAWSIWMIVAGFFIMVAAQMEDQGLLFQSVIDTILMRDIMLTDFATISASDTLEDALQKSVHTLQEDFPVVRGPNLVGMISRQSIVEALAREGNGYVQGVMQRVFQVAQPQDTLGKIFRQMRPARGTELVPVLDGQRVVGIVTPQNLKQAMAVLAEGRRLKQQTPQE